MVASGLHISVAAGCAGLVVGLLAGRRLAGGRRRALAALVGAAVFAAIAARWGPTPECAQFLGFAGILLALSVEDLESRTIPDWCIAAALLVRLAYIALEWALGEGAPGALLEAAIGFAVLGTGSVAAAFLGDRLSGRESLGGGDMKLFAAAGFYFGWERGLALVFASCLFGLATSLFTARGKDRAFPFGPAIAAACVTMMLFG